MHEERDRWDVDSSSRPGVTYKVEKETHEKQIGSVCVFVFHCADCVERRKKQHFIFCVGVAK